MSWSQNPETHNLCRDRIHEIASITDRNERWHKALGLIEYLGAYPEEAGDNPCLYTSVLSAYAQDPTLLPSTDRINNDVKPSKRESRFRKLLQFSKDRLNRLIFALILVLLACVLSGWRLALGIIVVYAGLVCLSKALGECMKRKSHGGL